MKNAIIILLTSCISFCKLGLFAQSDDYLIESFQDEYAELTDYESVALLNQGDPLFFLEFELDFLFPFFGEHYDRINYDADAFGTVTQNEYYSFFLMEFSRGYAWDVVWDSTNIPSDVRYTHVFVNDMQAFVLQYTDMGFFADPDDEDFNPAMNFQIWFFENGIMEVHFGEMNMNGSPIYKPGKGFYCYTSSGGIDTTEICGPRMGILNPMDESDGIALSGNIENYEVSGNPYSVLNTLPPVGWIIRFKPKALGIFEPEYQFDEFVINPNPASSFIQIPDIGSSVSIYNLSGTKMYEGIAFEGKLNISTFPQGIYFVKSLSENGASVGRFIKL